MADSRRAVAAIDAGIGALNAEWVAWLSDDIYSAAFRMDESYTGWYRLAGDPPILIAKGWNGLTSGTLKNPVNRDEYGALVNPDEATWTNTTFIGAIGNADNHCGNWNSASPTSSSSLGDPHASDVQWTRKAAPDSATCDTQHHLYCIENGSL